MEYRRFGRSEFKISVLSCGTMRALDSQDVMTETIDVALTSGVNHLETASGYGHSERFLGHALHALKRPRDAYCLTTKICPTPDAASFETTLIACFEKLQVDRIDCLALHGLNTSEHLTWLQNPTGCMAVVRDWVAAGKINHVGFSTHGSLDLIQAAIATDYFDFINLHYGLFFRRNEPAITQATDRDMGIFIISPGDKGGMLYTPPPKLESLCAPLTPLAANYRFLLGDPRIHTLSVGPANPQEWEQPLRSIAPVQAESQVFDRLELAQTETLGLDQCSQCYECLPCPEEINIPEVLRLRNLSIAYDMKAFGEYRYGMFEKAGHWFPGKKGDRCTDCGDCLPRCPENLDIPTLLRDTHNSLAGKARRRLWET